MIEPNICEHNFSIQTDRVGYEAKCDKCGIGNLEDQVTLENAYLEKKQLSDDLYKIARHQEKENEKLKAENERLKQRAIKAYEWGWLKRKEFDHFGIEYDDEAGK